MLQKSSAYLLGGLISFFCVCPSAQAENSLGLHTTDQTGCYLSGGTFTGPTIVLMTGAYNTPSLRKEVALQIMATAIAAGCDINEPDAMGMSPLNAAILYNQPELVSFLLGKGASPQLEISSTKQSINGLDSFELLALLTEKQPARNREAIKLLLQAQRDQ